MFYYCTQVKCILEFGHAIFFRFSSAIFKLKSTFLVRTIVITIQIIYILSLQMYVKRSSMYLSFFWLFCYSFLPLSFLYLFYYSFFPFFYSSLFNEYFACFSHWFSLIKTAWQHGCLHVIAVNLLLHSN